jgi:hypothetical protein
VALKGHVVHLPRYDRVGTRVRILDQFLLSGHGHGLRGTLSHLERDLAQGDLLERAHQQVVQFPVLETAGLNGQFVAAGDHRREDEEAFLIADRGGDSPGFGLHEPEAGGGKRGAGGVT